MSDLMNCGHAEIMMDSPYGNKTTEIIRQELIKSCIMGHIDIKFATGGIFSLP